MAMVVILDVPKMQSSIILVRRLRYMDMVRIMGLLKSFDFVISCIGGAFFKKGIDRVRKKKMALGWFL